MDWRGRRGSAKRVAGPLHALTSEGGWFSLNAAAGTGSNWSAMSEVWSASWRRWLQGGCAYSSLAKARRERKLGEAGSPIFLNNPPLNSSPCCLDSRNSSVEVTDGQTTAASLQTDAGSGGRERLEASSPRPRTDLLTSPCATGPRRLPTRTNLVVALVGMAVGV